MAIKFYCGSGQSNCNEGAHIQDLSPGVNSLQDIYPNATQVMKLGSSGPVVFENYGPEDVQPRYAIGNPLGPRNRIGHSVTIARGLRNYWGANQVVVGRCSVASTSITEWLPTAPPPAGQPANLYTQLIEFIEAQLLAFNADFEGFWWTQGNSDALQEELATIYLPNMVTFFSALRADVGLPNLRIVYDQLCPNCPNPFVDTVRAAQVAYAAIDPHARMVPTDFTYMLEDADHYTADTFMRLGWNFVDRFLNRLTTDGLLGDYTET